MALALAAPLSAGAAPSEGVRRDVEYLLAYIGDSGCQFNRNGSWVDARAAQAHVRMKYDQLAAGDKIATARDFIDKAASVSSLSGTPYQVRCANAAPVTSGAWLSDALAKRQAATAASAR
jgi:hypothetical protein